MEVSGGEVLEEALGEVLPHHVGVALAEIPLLEQGAGISWGAGGNGEAGWSTGRESFSSSSASLRIAWWYFWIFSTLER